MRVPKNIRKSAQFYPNHSDKRIERTARFSVPFRTSSGWQLYTLWRILLQRADRVNEHFWNSSEYCTIMAMIMELDHSQSICHGGYGQSQSNRTAPLQPLQIAVYYASFLYFVSIIKEQQVEYGIITQQILNCHTQTIFQFSKVC